MLPFMQENREGPLAFNIADGSYVGDDIGYALSYVDWFYCVLSAKATGCATVVEGDEDCEANNNAHCTYDH